MIGNFEIEPVVLYVNAQVHFRMLLSCSDLPLKFESYQQNAIFSNWFELSQAIAANYSAAAILKVGWALGSLEILGSPGTLVRNIGAGFRDFFRIPYEGITRSPTHFIWGIGRGSSSLVSHMASGTLRSITSFTSSIARNMEKLSMDDRHIQEKQALRTQYQSDSDSNTLTSGLVSGVTSLGLSLVSAVRGVVDQPLQEVQKQSKSGTKKGFAATPQSLVTGFGKGVFGAVTKPVGGAMDLVSHSSQGLIDSLGLSVQLKYSTEKKSLRQELSFPMSQFPLLNTIIG